jgi:hypothetical protein
MSTLSYLAFYARIMFRTPNAWLWRDQVSAAIMIIALAVAKR